MNSFERKKIKRDQESLKKWKKKAMDRNVELRKEKQKNRDLSKSRTMWRERFFSVKKELEQATLPVSLPPAPIVNTRQIYFIMVSLCINLTINCSVSFRSVPKILSVFANLFRYLGIPFELMIPHFTTVINWTLRVGKYILDKNLKPLSQPWICILDHTIQVGTKKALVILRVPVSALQSYGALTLKDVEVVFIKVQEKCDGIIVEDILKSLFKFIGNPLQIVMDGGPDIKKGVRLLVENMINPFKITYDITHLIANLLKKKYTSHYIFNNLLSHMAQSKNKIQQTAFSYLIPLKERSKSRFLNLPSIAKWTRQIMSYLEDLSKNNQNNEHFSQVILHFSWMFEYQDFLKDFWQEIQILADIQKLLKKITLNELNYKRASLLIEQIRDPALRIPLLDYIKSEFEFAKDFPYRLLLTSDVIESLFGKYKDIAKTHSLSEINRMILSLPCISENITPELIQEAFTHTLNKDVQQWIQEEISETLLSKRRNALGGNKNPKTAAQIINFLPQNSPLENPYSTGQKTVGTIQALG